MEPLECTIIDGIAIFERDTIEESAEISTKINGKHRRGDEPSPDIGMCPVNKRLKMVPSLAHEKTHLRVSHALLNPNTDVLLQRCTTTSRTKRGHT